MNIQNYPIRTWRCIWDVTISWAWVILAIYLAIRVSWWFYPVSVLIIANRLLALSLLCHEALHFTLLPNRKWNDFVGRYFCAFPSSVSLSRYRRWHLMHHRALGSERWDPDLHLFDFYPLSKSDFVKAIIFKTLSGSTAYSFLIYYTDIIDGLKGYKSRLGLDHESDFVSYVAYWGVVIGFVLVMGWHVEFLLLYLVPLIFITQPYVLLMAGLQHGPRRPQLDSQLNSRSVKGPKWFMELVLPVDINYHGAHHFNQSIPHYWLKRFSEDLKQSGTRLWEESYLDAMRSLFPAKCSRTVRALSKIAYR